MSAKINLKVVKIRPLLIMLGLGPVLFFSSSVQADFTPNARFQQCYISYPGCSKLHLPCMPLLKDLDSVKKQLTVAYTLSPDPKLLLICSQWKSWKAVESFPDFKEIYDQSAKHWFIQVKGEALGPLSRDQLKQLKNGESLDGIPQGFVFTQNTKVWSEVRMGKNAQFKKAAEISEIFFKVLNDEPSDDEIIL